MSIEYGFQVLERVKSRVASVKANWGFPATTPLLDRVIGATAQIRARVTAFRAPSPVPPAPVAQYYYPAEYTEYQLIEEEKPEVK